MSNVPDEIEITAPVSSEYAEILSPAAIAFLADLQRTFGVRRKELLAARVARQTLLDAGVKPDFLPETKLIREGKWRCACVQQSLTSDTGRDNSLRRTRNAWRSARNAIARRRQNLCRTQMKLVR